MVTWVKLDTVDRPDCRADLEKGDDDLQLGLQVENGGDGAQLPPGAVQPPDAVADGRERRHGQAACGHDT
jgi:hypothetical protein